MISFPKSIFSESFPLFKKLPPSMTSIRERKILKYLARDFYSGTGEIVDLGSGAGGTVYPLALGLSQNSQVVTKQTRIHAYDAFTPLPYYIPARGGTIYFRDSRETTEKFYKKSYLTIFQKNCKNLIDYVDICDGDITTLSWTGQPIEIIHIDVAKSLKIWQHLVKEFFPHFQTNQTIIVNQDFHRSRLPWLIYGIGILLPYLDMVDFVVDGVTYFKVVQEIPTSVLECLAKDDFDIDSKITAINKMIEVLDNCTYIGTIDKDIMKGLMNLSIAYVYYYFGHKQTAATVAKQLKEEKRLVRQFSGFFKELNAL